MQKFWTYSILFLLFIFEGALTQFFSLDNFYSLVTIVPYFVLVMVTFVSIFQSKNRGLTAGLIFGLLFDIVYGKMIGVHFIGMGLVGYFSGWITQYFHRSFPLYVLIVTFGILFFDLYSYGTLRLLNLIDISIRWEFLQVTIPTVIVNGIFAILIFRPLQFLIEDEKIEE